DPNNFKAHFMLGKAFMGMSYFQEALEEFERLLSLRQTSGDAHLMKGEALRMLGRYDEAEDEYKQTLKIDAQNALAHAYLGECHRVRGSHRAGAIECRRAIQLDSHLIVAHLILAQCYLDNHRTDSALDEYKVALDLNPKDALVRTKYGQALAGLERWPEAVE